MSNKHKNPRVLNIGLLTAPSGKYSDSYYSITMNFIRILTPLVENLLIISENLPERYKKRVINKKVGLTDNNCIFKRDFYQIFRKIIANLIMQIRLSFVLMRVFNRIDCVFIFSGTLLLPTLFARIFGKKPILTALASESSYAKYQGYNYLYFIIIKFLEFLTIQMSYKITVESPNVAVLMRLNRKLLPSGPLFIISDNFKIINPINKRENNVGYIGRLSEEKGVLNYLKSISKVSVKYRLKFLVIGDGQLRQDVEDRKYIYGNLEILDRIPHEDLPYRLNQLKLLVIPSYTEGLPNIMLEAMACGTPVLATPVGGIPDIIKDGETGFLMENNSSECIAINIIRAMEDHDLGMISKNARILLESEFTYEVAVKRWRNILKSI